MCVFNVRLMWWFDRSAPSSPDISPQSSPRPPRANNDRLSLLTRLVKKGEKKGLFVEKMPARIFQVHLRNLHLITNVVFPGIVKELRLWSERYRFDSESRQLVIYVKGTVNCSPGAVLRGCLPLCLGYMYAHCCSLLSVHMSFIGRIGLNVNALFLFVKQASY